MQFGFAKKITCNGTSEILGDFSLSVDRPYEVMDMCSHLNPRGIGAIDNIVTFKQGLKSQILHKVNFVHAGEVAFFEPDQQFTEPSEKITAVTLNNERLEFSVWFQFFFNTSSDEFLSRSNQERSGGSIAFTFVDPSKWIPLSTVRLTNCQAQF